MGARVPLVLAGLAIAGIVAWLSLRGDARQTTNPDPRVLTPSSPSGAPTAPRIPAPPEAPGAGASAGAGEGDGETPRLPPAATPPPAEVAFVAEPRDESWAAPTEREIARRFERIRGTLASVECRRAQCRLVLTGGEAELADTIADLEGPRGMHGFANNVLLTAPATRDDGTIELRAYLLFER